MQVLGCFILIELRAFVLLNHHVNGFLSVLEVELIELLSLVPLSFRLLLHLLIFHRAAKCVHGLIASGTSTKYFLSQDHVSVVPLGKTLSTTEAIVSLRCHGLVVHQGVIVSHGVHQEERWVVLSFLVKSFV